METRLNLLCDAGVIDKDICKGMMQVVKCTGNRVPSTGAQ